MHVLSLHTRYCIGLVFSTETPRDDILYALPHIRCFFKRILGKDAECLNTMIALSDEVGIVYRRNDPREAEASLVIIDLDQYVRQPSLLITLQLEVEGENIKIKKAYKAHTLGEEDKSILQRMKTLIDETVCDLRNKLTHTVFEYANPLCGQRVAGDRVSIALEARRLFAREYPDVVISDAQAERLVNTMLERLLSSQKTVAIEKCCNSNPCRLMYLTICALEAIAAANNTVFDPTVLSTMSK
jgi:hypothetical protein